MSKGIDRQPIHPYRAWNIPAAARSYSVPREQREKAAARKRVDEVLSDKALRDAEKEVWE
jgi:hypothetical protein